MNDSMMTESDFFKSLEDARKLLSEYDLLKKYIRKNIGHTRHKIDSRDDFETTYKSILTPPKGETPNYNFLLEDFSILQFSYKLSDTNQLLLMYCYFEQPFDYPSYLDYLSDNDLKFSDVGYDYEYEYIQDFTSADLRDELHYIRYDHCYDLYKQGRHSVAHFHIGMIDSIRLSTNKVLTPEAFVLFVLKQLYYDKIWVPNMGDTVESLLKTRFQAHKNNCDDVIETNFTAIDRSELYFT